MGRFVSNLKLLHKLAIPGVMIVIAALATVSLAKSWMDLSEAHISAIVDQHAARLERVLTIVGNLTEATLTQRDLRLAHKVEDAERLAAEYRSKLMVVERQVEAIIPLMVDPEQRKLAEDAKAAFARFFGVGGEQSVQIIEALKTNTPPPSNGRGRVWRQQVDEILGKIVTRSREDMVRAKEEGISDGRRAAMMLIGVTAFAQLVALGMLAWIAIVQVARPLGGITALMSRLAGGDLTVDVDSGERRDEVGALARALAVFKGNAIEAKRVSAQQEADRANKVRRAQALEQLTKDFESRIETLANSLASAARQMQTAAQSMSSTADGAQEQSVAVAAASEEASANVATVAAATEELAASIKEIARQVTESASISGRAAEEAKRTDQTVQALSESAQKIGEVVELINSIAAQTNLLALNATIEAARAGEAGKGFAVVAAEVKTLAAQTAAATGEIAGQVNQIQGATKEAVAVIRGVAGTIEQINQIASAIAAAVEEQGAATEDIARTVQQAAKGTQDVSANIAGLRQAATETRGNAGQVLDASDALSNQAHQLTSGLAEFLAATRAA
jgi:methyl-accepting chemotaxis protein